MITSSPNLWAVAAMSIMPTPGISNAVSKIAPVPQEAALQIAVGNVLIVDVQSSIEQHFAAIGKLLLGWDGANGQPINARAIQHAKRIVDYAQSLPGRNGTPAIVPCADGSIQIEWHLRDSRFEMYFETDGSTSAWWHDRGSGQETEAEGEAATVLLGRWAVRDAAWAIMAIAA